MDTGILNGIDIDIMLETLPKQCPSHAPAEMALRSWCNRALQGIKCLCKESSEGDFRENLLEHGKCARNPDDGCGFKNKGTPPLRRACVFFDRKFERSIKNNNFTWENLQGFMLLVYEILIFAGRCPHTKKMHVQHLLQMHCNHLFLQRPFSGHSSF